MKPEQLNVFLRCFKNAKKDDEWWIICKFPQTVPLYHSSVSLSVSVFLLNLMMKLHLNLDYSRIKLALRAKRPHGDQQTFTCKSKRHQLSPSLPSAVLWQAEPASLSCPVPLWIQAALLLQPIQRLLLLQVP